MCTVPSLIRTFPHHQHLLSFSSLLFTRLQHLHLIHYHAQSFTEVHLTTRFSNTASSSSSLKCLSISPIYYNLQPLHFIHYHALYSLEITSPPASRLQHLHHLFSSLKSITPSLPFTSLQHPHLSRYHPLHPLSPPHHQHLLYSIFILHSPKSTADPFKTCILPLSSPYLPSPHPLTLSSSLYFSNSRTTIFFQSLPILFCPPLPLLQITSTLSNSFPQSHLSHPYQNTIPSSPSPSAPHPHLSAINNPLCVRACVCCWPTVLASQSTDRPTEP